MRGADVVFVQVDRCFQERREEQGFHSAGRVREGEGGMCFYPVGAWLTVGIIRLLWLTGETGVMESRPWILSRSVSSYTFQQIIFFTLKLTVELCFWNVMEITIMEYYLLA